jgi:hypothetical protein
VLVLHAISETSEMSGKSGMSEVGPVCMQGPRAFDELAMKNRGARTARLFKEGRERERRTLPAWRAQAGDRSGSLSRAAYTGGANELVGSVRGATWGAQYDRPGKWLKLQVTKNVYVTNSTVKSAARRVERSRVDA